MSIAYKNNSFKAILNVSKPILDSDQVATDLHFFFKRSTARREDYKMVENITEVTMHYMKKHVESPWLSIDRSLVQILEQMENLRKMVWQMMIGIRGSQVCSNSKSRNLHVICCFHFAIFQSFSQALAHVFVNDSSTLPNVSVIGSQAFG